MQAVLHHPTTSERQRCRCPRPRVRRRQHREDSYIEHDTDVLEQQFVQTARSKGLTERVVMCKHAVRNALHPLVQPLDNSGQMAACHHAADLTPAGCH